MEDAAAFVDAVVLLASPIDDPPDESWARVCRDPDDDYLVALAETNDVTLLVSGDRDLLDVQRPGLDVRSPRATIDAISSTHPWGPALIPAEAEAAWAQSKTLGHSDVLETTAAFLIIVAEPDAAELLPQVVTPESLHVWRAELQEVRSLAGGRGMASGVDRPAEDVAYVKLPPILVSLSGPQETSCWKGQSLSPCSGGRNFPMHSVSAAGASTASATASGPRIYRIGCPNPGSLSVGILWLPVGRRGNV